MIHVARELHRIEKCFRALTIALCTGYIRFDTFHIAGYISLCTGYIRVLTRKKPFSFASAERRKKEEDCYLKNGGAVLEELLALCDGNCRIPIRYFTATEIERAIKHSKSKMELSHVSMVTGSLDNHPV
ncbi:hypothetical protein H5410_032709 [Solanum commersonii]|uniref:Uncharacterized protein n=1 Tax=Solanum commersonii TaxID=4109 RepID=A0A9J5YKP6_SOLCO|nr:hypothetical protein H5410_032709 [Solanum commersonii]